MNAAQDVARVRRLIDRTTAEIDRVDAMPEGRARAERFAKVNAWLDTEWPKIPEAVRREALGERGC